MLWDWSIAVSITLSLILGAVVASFFLKSIFAFKSDKSTSLERELRNTRRSIFVNFGLSYIFQIVNSIVEICSKVFEVPAIIIYLLSIVWSNRQLLLFLLISSLTAYTVFHNGDSLLSSFDNSYRCWILPVVNNIVFSILHVGSYIYGTYVPLWNTVFFLNRQLIIGTRLILVSCATSTLTITSFFGGFATFIKVIFITMLDYLGLPTVTSNSNLVVNEFKMYAIVESFRMWLDWIPSVLICSCKGVTPWIQATLYGFFEKDHIDYIAHHFVNAAITFMQVFLKSLPPFLTYPDFGKVIYHIVSIILESGVLFDAWLGKFVATFIQQIGANLIIDVPTNFVGKAFAHFETAIVHGIETFGNSTLHTVVPFDRPTDVTYMQEVYSLEKTFSHLGMFSYDFKHIVSWSLQTLVYVLMMKTWERKCTNFAGCVQYASGGQCAIACEGNAIHFYATNAVCPAIIDMEEKYIAKKAEFDKLQRQLQGSFVNGFKSGSTASLLEDEIFSVKVTQVSSNILVESSLGDKVIDKQLLTQEPKWDDYIRNVYMRRYHSIFDTAACGLESLVNVMINLLHLVYDLSNTLIWDYFFGNAFDGTTLSVTELRAILEKHLGPPFGRDYDPPSYNAINSTWDTSLRTYNGYKHYVEKNSITRYNDINFHEHVLHEIDKAASYLLAHTFEENTFGKIFFNTFRLYIELVRSMAESVMNNQLDEKIGCNRNYNGTVGSCTSNFDANNKMTLCAASNRQGCVCNPLLPLTVNSNCQCIWKVKTDKSYFTTAAVANYCRLNLFEFMFVFPRRVVEGARNIVQSLQVGNSAFPATPNKCLIEAPNGFKRLLYQQTQVFSKKYVTMYPDLQCSTYYSQDFACNFGDVLVKLSDLLLQYVKDIIRNAFVIVGNIAKRNKYGNIELDFSDEVCNIQKTIASVAPMLVSITSGFRVPSKHNSKIYFAIIDILSVVLQTVDIVTLSFRDELLDVNVSGEFNLLDLFEDIVIRTLDVAFTWILQLVKAIADYEEPASSVQQAIVATTDDIHSVVSSIVRVAFWVIDFVVSNIIKILNTAGSAAYKRADDRVQRRLQQLANVVSEITAIIMETFLNDIQQALNLLKETVCSGLCSIEKSIPGMSVGDLGSNVGFCEAYDTNSCPSIASALEGFGDDVVSTGGNVLSDIGSAFGLRRRRLLASEDIVSLIAGQAFWNGTTTCDLLMRSFRNDTVDTLTRLENVFFQDCVSRRIEGEAISKFIHVPYLSDLFYNWKKPLQVAYHTGRIAFIYVPWSFGNTSTKELRYHLGLAGYDAKSVLHFIKKWKQMAKTTQTSYKQKFNSYKKDRTLQTKHFIGTLHHLMFHSDWRQHQELLQVGIASIFRNSSKIEHAIPKDFRFLSKRVTSVIDNNIIINDATFGYYDNMECPADSLICLDCALVDNFVYATVKQVEHSVDFYKGSYRTVIEANFNNHWENETEFSRKYEKAYRESVFFKSTLSASLASDPTFVFTDWLLGVLRMERSVFELSEGVVNFVVGNYTGELSSDAVQIFPNDLYYYTKAFFDRDCDDPSVIYTSYSDRVGDGIFNVFMIFLAWELVQLLAIRFNALASILIYISLSSIATFVYYYTVYSFNPLCAGMLPSFLINDFLMWLEKEVFLDCFCSYIPSLSMQPCAQQTCDTCDANIEYYSCKDVATGFSELGAMWHFMFLFRWFLPETFGAFGNSNVWPLPYLFELDGMQQLLQDINRKISVTSKEISCFYLNILTPVSVVAGAYILLLMTLPILRIIIKIGKELFMILCNVLIALIYFARTLQD